MRCRKVSLLIVMLLLPTNQLLADEPTRPNIIIIVADDLGWADVGYHGSPLKTPTIDKLVRQGVELDQFYVAPMCTPTRAALMTGRYWSRFGVTAPSNTQVLPMDTVTLAKALLEIGYDTAITGKWHLGSLLRWGPQLFGFRISYGSLAGGVGPWNHFYKRGKYSKTWHRNGKLIEEKGHVTDLIAREATKFIRQKRKSPFFLYVPFTAVHVPFDEPDRWMEANINIPKERRQYAAAVQHMDHAIGQIVKTLKQTKQYDNTIILFFSDNGGTDRDGVGSYPGTYPFATIFGLNHPLRGWKRQLYEGGVRVPAFIHWPKQLPAGKVTTPLHVIDWMPTLCKLTGYKAKKNLKWDGIDVWPALKGKHKKIPDRVLYWHGVGGRSAALRKGDWKLIVSRAKKAQKDRTELYDLKNDPYEKNDLSRQNSKIISELTKVLEQETAKDNDAVVRRKSSKPTSSMILEVNAGKHDRPWAIASWKLPEAWRNNRNIRLVSVDDKKAVPVQRLSSGERLLWLIERPLKANTKRYYRLSSDPSQSSSLDRQRVYCKEDKKGLSLSLGKKPVLRYHTSVVPCPVPGKASCRRSGFLHPVYDPAGRVLTDDFPPDHAHQHGVMFAWTKTTFENRKVDFWNQAKKLGTVEHTKILAKTSGSVFAEFKARLNHVDLSAPKKPKAALEESWTVRLYNLRQYYVFEIESVQTTNTRSPLLVNKYHYGGMAIRGNRQWLSKGKGDFLTSEGKTRKNGNHSRPNWVDVWGMIKGKPSGIAMFCHPRNFRAPQPVRLHPSKPYFCWSPQVLGRFTISPGKQYTSRYRFVVHTGQPDPKMLEQVWRDYSEPVTVRVSDQ
ncbi:MAG: DUF6807 family protein [Gemmataceae bacterium]